MPKNTPKLRFKGFSEPWATMRLGDCVLIQRGGSPRPIEKFITRNENGVNWIKIGDVATGSRYITKTEEKIIPEGAKHSRNVYKGDLILSNSMSFGRPYITGIDGCIHDGWLLIRDENKLFNLEYLLQLLSSDFMLKQYKSLASGGVVNNLNSELVQSTTIHLPNLTEQTQIGEYFKSLDALISLRQSQYDKLLAVKKACLAKMFPKQGTTKPQLRFKGFSEPWATMRLGEVGSTYGGLSGKTREDFGHGKPFISYMNVYKNTTVDVNEISYVSMKDNEKQNLVKKGDILFTISSETPDEIGMSSFVNCDLGECYLNSFCFGFRPYQVNLISSGYYFRSDVFRQQIVLLAQGATRYNLSKTAFLDLKISLPKNIAEQTQIGEYFKKLDHLISLRQVELEKLKNIKKACLAQMFV